MRVISDGSTRITFTPIEKEKVSIQKVEIVVPSIKSPPLERVSVGFAIAVALLIRTALVFWLVASWVPELGITFWQLILPLYVVSFISHPIAFKGRYIPGSRLRRAYGTTEFEELLHVKK